MNYIRIQALMREYAIEYREYGDLDWLPALGTIEDEDARDYFLRCVPASRCCRKSIGLMTLETIKSNIGTGSPDCHIIPYGFLPIAGTTGGNTICLDGREGGVYFADNSFIADDGVLRIDKQTKRRVFYQGLSRQNLLKAMPLIHHSLEEFLVQFISGDLAVRIDKDFD
ncbi:hypothetical protein HY256_11200 [Candidatus Sumerlaeota bacterium]|nr:hypothetical protein [Candidatus Sumerlaeota bacterium]